MKFDSKIKLKRTNHIKVNSLIQAFDTRNWSLLLKTLATHGNESVLALCNYYSDLLSAEERAAIPNEFQKMKVRYSMTGGCHPLGFLIDVLKVISIFNMHYYKI